MLIRNKDQKFLTLYLFGEKSQPQLLPPKLTNDNFS